MVSRTAWTAGNGVGYTWSTLINSADMASLAIGSTVRSTVADITNQTAQDQFMDISVRLAIATTVVAAGNNATIYLYALLDDGVTYGDGMLPTAGTAVASATSVSAVPPAAIINFFAGATRTTLVGFAQGIILPPGSFRAAIQNNGPAALSAGTQTCMYRTYNQNLNN